MPTTRATVRLAPGAQQWLDAYVAALPAWNGIEATGYATATATSATPVGGSVVDVRSSAPRQPGAGEPQPAVPDLSLWQVIREVREVSTARALRTRTDIVAAVVDATGVAPTRVADAIAYWAQHPDEVTARLHS